MSDHEDELPDWLDASEMKRKAEAYMHADELVRQRIIDIQSGKIRQIATPWKAIDDHVCANMPGTVNVLCGDPGSAKSFMTLELFAHLHRSGEKVALYELECTKQWHLMRVLAQEIAYPEITKIKHLQQYQHTGVLDRLTEHSAFIRSFGACIHASPDACITAEELLRWVEEQCSNGVKMVGIDPITALMPSEKPWLDDHHLITQLRRIIGKYDAVAWIVTHPKKGRGAEIGLDVLAGGTAFARFTDTVLWLERLNGETPHQVYGSRQHVSGDRVLHVCKCRDGDHAGKKLLMQLNKGNLKFTQLGWIEKKIKDQDLEDEAKDVFQ